MLNQKNRLTKKKDFDAVFKRGRGFKQGCLYFKIKENDLSFSRFGFIVSKKFSKKAVERNKIRRRLREIIKKKLLPVKEPKDIVIIVNPGAENDFEKLEQAINSLFKKANLI
ncbi:MAG: ribonuclease P protein component [bacterium]|nr:ribonuclease P protein component [bacterium]